MQPQLIRVSIDVDVIAQFMPFIVLVVCSVVEFIATDPALRCSRVLSTGRRSLVDCWLRFRFCLLCVCFCCFQLGPLCVCSCQLCVYFFSIVASLTCQLIACNDFSEK